MSTERVTIKDIAASLDLSLGTVSKALAGKSGVSDETRGLILNAAESMGYNVNRLAQSLARNPLVIGVLIPSVWPYHYGLFEQGIRETLENLRDFNVSGTFHYVNSLYASEEIGHHVEMFMKEKVDAVIMCPSFDSEYKNQLDKLKEAKIPVVLLGTDIDGAQRLSCVGIASKLAGKMAADLIQLATSEDKHAAVLIGNKDMEEHCQKADGFCEVTSYFKKNTRVFETQDEPKIAYHITNKIIRDFPDIGGLFVATGNSLAVCECLKKHGLGGIIKVVATDIFPELEEYVKDGYIQGVVVQNQKEQATRAVMALFDYLAEHTYPEQNIYVDPHLLLRSNLMGLF